jgi:hypothetical protein
MKTSYRQSPYKDKSLGLPEYEAEVLSTMPLCSVKA